MYKVSHTSMPRPALVYNGHRTVTRCELNEKKALNHYLIEDVPYKNKMQLPLPIFSKKPPQRSTPPVSKHVDSEAVSRLRNSWHDFSHTKDGRPDKSIVHYRATKEMPKDFVAFDVEKYLTERLLRAVNLDPRIVNGLAANALSVNNYNRAHCELRTNEILACCQLRGPVEIRTGSQCDEKMRSSLHYRGKTRNVRSITNRLVWVGCTQMTGWTCRYCTLENNPSSVLCAACGSENPFAAGPNGTKQRNILERIPKVSLSGALNAIDSALTSAGLLPSAFSNPSPTPSNSKWYSPIVDRIISPTVPNPPNPPNPPSATSRAPDRLPNPTSRAPDRLPNRPNRTSPSSGTRNGHGHRNSSSDPALEQRGARSGHSSGGKTELLYPKLPMNPEGQQAKRSQTKGKLHRTGSGGGGAMLAPSRSPSEPSLQSAQSSSSSNMRQKAEGHGDEQNIRLCSSSSIHLEKRDVQDASNAFLRISQFCKSNKIPFIDDSFPHSERSIGDLSANGGTGKRPISVKELVWLRPQDMFTKDGRAFTWTVFRDPKASDIEQGCLGNCWFLSALAVIAERPDILEQIVLSKVYSPFGIYQIRLCVGGRWQVVVIDDFFPCKTRTRGLAFAVARRNQLWVPLIEKAFAKISGSYGMLLAGRTVEGLAVLTGAPCSQLDLENATTHDQQEILWASLLSMREARFIMGCSCGAGKRYVNEAEYKAVGLQPRHAYSLLDVTEYHGHRLVRLRNPWGTFVWNGEWSDTWPGWTAQSRAALLPEGPEAGTFWMPFPRFLNHFDTVDVAKVRSAFGWKELRVDCSLQPSWGRHHITALRVHVEHSTEVAFTVYQAGSRQRTESDVVLLVHRAGPPNTHLGELFVRSARKMAPFVSTGDVFLRGPADYVVLAVSFSNIYTATQIDLIVAVHRAMMRYMLPKSQTSEKRDNTLKWLDIRQTREAEYGAERCERARPLSAEKVRLPASAVTDSLIEMSLKEGKVHEALEGVVSRYVSNDFSGHILVIDNLHENKYLQVYCDCSKSTNVLSTRFTMMVVDSIPPLHRQVVMMLNHFEPTQSYYVGHSLTQRVTSFKGLRDWVSLVPGRLALPADTQHVPPLDDPAVAVLHRPRPLFR